MKISPLTTGIYRKNTTNFGTSERTLYQNCSTKKEYQKQYYSVYEDYIGFKKGYNPDYSCVRIKNSNKTLFFRDDMYYSMHNDWSGFAKFLDIYFSKDKKINVYDFACSDGSEAYSLAICLIEELGEKEAERFFPIQAMDIDPFIIKKASSGKIKCDKGDVKTININTHGKFDKYFNIIKEGPAKYTLEAKDILKKAVVFKRKDIKDGMDEVEASNSVILCRNMWPYLKRETMCDTLLKMRKRLDDKSLIIIGDFDREYNCDMLPFFFSKAGLKEIHRNVLVRDKNPDTPNINTDEKEYRKLLLNWCEYDDD